MVTPELVLTQVPSRERILRSWLEVLLGVPLVLRLVLAVCSGIAPRELPGVLALGTFFDLAFAAYASAPVLLYLALAPRWLWRTRLHRGLGLAAWFLFVYFSLFLATAEWFFWDEFGARFNFIAVDYLAHTREVVGNIRESYPLPAILLTLAPVALLIAWQRRGAVLAGLRAHEAPRRWRLALTALLMPTLTYATVDAGLADAAGDRIASELAGNGLYSMGHAFLSNRLDYEDYYVTLPREKVLEDVQRLVGARKGAPGNPIERSVTSSAPAQRRNLVVIGVESLSAWYLERFRRPGDDEVLTPRLDDLARRSLCFTQMYSTGVRTVRGLEAISLSLPPTPGRSIIKRDRGNTGLRTLGTVLRDAGYDTRFVYGGYALFDNMRGFFSANGYRVVDRTDIDDANVAGENVWGIADESLFDQTLRECDDAAATGRPFHAFVMTTSNHRPYTYPEGRVAIPSGSGRRGAVQYTDYAIGRFLDMAAGRPWFDDTIFVVVADHCDSSRGYTRLPVDRFHIPMLVYAPRLLEPREIDGVCSQIDVAPTLLGLLGLNYESTFFGVDLVQERPGRALLCNYLHVGLWDGRTLVTLGPQRAVSFDFADPDGAVTAAPENPRLLEEAITYVQGASIALDEGLLRVQGSGGL
jgi:phosphoglycerol transferase MdoB-like AlkP superfamily enzyme